MPGKKNALLDPVYNWDLVGYIGKQLTVTFEFRDENEDIVPLTGYTASAKIVDEDNTTVLDLSPTIAEANGQMIIDVEVTSSIPPGRYDWRAYLIESDGDEHVRFRGKVKLETY